MARYQYICRHIEAYQHEYKLLISGKMTIDQLPEECVSGFLYFFLRQFIDYVQVETNIDDQVENTDELTEDYYFDSFLGVMDRVKDKAYGKENINMAAYNLMRTHELLEEASELIHRCILENQNSVKDLFERLWSSHGNAVEFFGDEKALEHAKALSDSGFLLDDLYEIAMDVSEDADDCVEELIDALIEYAESGEQPHTKLWEPDDEDLPFN